VFWFSQHRFTQLSEVDAGAKAELRIPPRTAYPTVRRLSWLSRKFTANA
jgi:hypothetical protein